MIPKFNNVVRLLMSVALILAALSAAGTAYGPAGRYSFCAGDGCLDGQTYVFPTNTHGSVSEQSFGFQREEIVVLKESSMTIPGPAITGNEVNRYGGLDTGADIIAYNMVNTSVKVDAEMGSHIIKWLKIAALRLSPQTQGTFDSECPEDAQLHPLPSEAGFQQMVRDAGPMNAGQFNLWMWERGFLAVGSVDGGNIAVVSGPMLPDGSGLVSYLRLIGFSRDQAGNPSQLILDMPFSPETITADPIAPLMQPSIFTL